MLTEQTVRELYNSMVDFKNKDSEKTICHVKSNYSKYDFEIAMETEPHTQESLGFKVMAP